jgi:transcription elongation GreA/GreB family factor
MDKIQIKKISLAFDIPTSAISDCLKKVTPTKKATKTIEGISVEDYKTLETIRMEEYFYFLEKDFDELNNKISIIQDEISRLGQEIAHSVDVSGETFHDNFVYDEGNRQQEMWSNELKKLLTVKNKSKIFQLSKEENQNIIMIGKNVLLMVNDKQIHIKIGSYLNFDKKSISYASEFAQNIINLKKGEKKEFIINHKKIKVTVLEIT